MPDMTISYPAGEGVRIMNALCSFEALPPTQANALQALRSHIIRTVKSYEYSQSMAAVVPPTEVTPT